MGILNLTPDSFYDGGYFTDPNKACRRALDMIEQGADIIDIGGESSRPGANCVSLDEELNRVIPIIEKLTQLTEIPISIDTYKPEVMSHAIEAGATMINDIRALQTSGALDVVAKYQVTVCLMHMKGEPKTMQQAPHYDNDIIDEINAFFSARIKACLDKGILRENIILDPGFGFGKTPSHNLLLIKRLNAFLVHQCPILLGVSRKSTIGAVLKNESQDRLTGSLSLAVLGVNNGANIIRAHDVKQTVEALKMVQAVSEVN